MKSIDELARHYMECLRQERHHSIKELEHWLAQYKAIARVALIHLTKGDDNDRTINTKIHQ